MRATILVKISIILLKNPLTRNALPDIAQLSHGFKLASARWWAQKKCPTPQLVFCHPEILVCCREPKEDWGKRGWPPVSGKSDLLDACHRVGQWHQTRGISLFICSQCRCGCGFKFASFLTYYLIEDRTNQQSSHETRPPHITDLTPIYDTHPTR